MYVLQGQRRPAIIKVNHRLNEYKRKARDLLTSEAGLKHRGRRCIEPEAVFGQMKFNMAYRRFHHFGKDEITMDFAFFAIAFNIKKMCSNIAKETNDGGNTHNFCSFLLIPRILGLLVKTGAENARNHKNAVLLVKTGAATALILLIDSIFKALKISELHYE